LKTVLKVHNRYSYTIFHYYTQYAKLKSPTPSTYWSYYPKKTAGIHADNKKSPTSTLH